MPKLFQPFDATPSWWASILTVWCLVTSLGSAPGIAAPSIQNEIRISSGEGGLPVGAIESAWLFGTHAALIDDVDGDGNRDLAVGAPRIGNPSSEGQVVILFLDDEGRAIGSSTIQGPPGSADFGSGVTNLGDFDGDGVADLLVGGAGVFHIGAPGPGSVWVVPLRPDGSAKSFTEIRSGVGGFPNTISTPGGFGFDSTVLGDIDGDGNLEVAVGAWTDSNLSGGAGAFHVISLVAPSGSIAWTASFDADSGLPFTLGGDNLGFAIEAIGDLDGDGLRELVVSDVDHAEGAMTSLGALYVLFLESSGPGTVSIRDYVRIRPGDYGLPGPATSFSLGSGLGWQPLLSPDLPANAPEQDGILYVSARGTGDWPIIVARLAPDGTIAAHYSICPTCGVGYTSTSTEVPDITPVGDLNGDETVDLIVGDYGYSAPAGPGAGNHGSLIVLQMIDSDHDGLDDALDNCPTVSNLDQADADGDGVGDLCDNCAALANSDQADGDADGEGDVCEPVEVRIEPTGTVAAPAWDLSLQCGAFDVTEVHGAIVLPAGAANPKNLTLSGTSIGAGSGTSGPGLAGPAGVRDDAIYFSAFGNGSPDDRLCTALDAPISLGTLTTGAIGGTQLAAAALSEEGVGTPGLGLSLAEDASAPIPDTAVRLVNGQPLPILDLEIGPAVETASGTKWEVRVARSNDEFIGSPSA